MSNLIRIPSFISRSIFLILIVGTLWGVWHERQLFLENTNGLLSVSFLDVGQGDAVYIRAPNGRDVLIDGGPYDSIIEKLKTQMPASDHDISLVIATHPDKDHIAGLIPVFETFEVQQFLFTEKSSGTSFDTRLKSLVEQESGIKTIAARRGQRIMLDEKQGVYLDVLYPDRDTGSFKETNTASVVVQLVYGNQRFLFTGDAFVDTEKFLVAHDGVRIASNVFKLGHHGSKTSSDEDFLKIVHPQYAIVSAGKNNTYHHPHPEVVSRVSNLGIPILSTIDLGTITFKTNGVILDCLQCSQ